MEVTRSRLLTRALTRLRAVAGVLPIVTREIVYYCLIPVSENPNKKKSLLIALSLVLLTIGAVICLASSVDVGSGAPSAGLTEQFQSAFYRNGFAYLVQLPPIDNVTRFGTTGVIQEFNAVGFNPNSTTTTTPTMNGGGIFALIDSTTSLAPPPSGQPAVAQVYPAMYSYYQSVGVSTAGYPITDTLNCPTPASGPTCQYQIFSLNYILFVYGSTTFNGTNFALRNPFLTKWNAEGGMSGLGPPTDIERSITGANSVTAAVQTYQNGAIYNLTSGSLSGSVFAVASPIYSVYASNGADGGFLGLPTSDNAPLTGGSQTFQQSFHGCKLQYTATPGQVSVPIVAVPVAAVSLQPYTNSVYKLTQGATLTVTAATFAPNGGALPGRVITWVSTNSKVATVTPVGPTATVTAVGAGTALITAISEGVVSPALTVTVTAVCCAIGDGASAVVQQAMQGAVTRDQLSIQLPTRNQAQQAGSGYTQQVNSTGNPPVTYLIAKSNASTAAYIVTGDILTRYNLLGGVTGSLGYPSSDGVNVGHQLFQNGALSATTPSYLVTGAILAEWAALSYDTGVLGEPGADATSIVASTGSKAQQQTFAKGTVYSEGSTIAQAQYVTGLIQSLYNSLGGPASTLGLPTDNASLVSGRMHQDFEGGYVDYAPGDPVATVHGAPLVPAISTTPASSVVAGSRLQIAVTGFTPGAILSVSITGQPPFVVNTTNGSYTWVSYVPVSAAAQTVAIQALDITNGPAGGATASASYTVKPLASASLKIAKVQGDSQTGAPGAQLSAPLQAQAQDSNGNPVSGIAVVWNASPGGQIVSSTAVTDGSGLAQATVRMPPSAGLALFTAVASGQVATFSATAAATSLANFPTFLENTAPWGTALLGPGPATIAQKGALLTAAAGILRYYVNQGSLTGPAVDPASLNAYLKAFCATAADGSKVCDGYLSNPAATEQIVNLWRVGGLFGGSVTVSVETPTLAAARDLVAQGSPVLLALALTANGAPAGGHFVVATGVAADGSLTIQDPNPGFAQTNLSGYLAGFSAGGAAWQATLSGAVRLLPQAPTATGFLVSALSQPMALLGQFTMDVSSANGECGLAIDFLDSTTTAPPAAAPLDSRFLACDGSQQVYQLSLGASQPYSASVTDLGAGGARKDLSGASATAYKLTRPAAQLVVAAQTVTILANGIVNGASLVPGVAPGGLMAIFGSGLAAPGATTTIQISGETAAPLSTAPFQLVAVAPIDLAPGTYPLNVQSPWGSAQQTITLQATAPAILLLPGSGGVGSTAYGLVMNPDGSVNSPLNPVTRGQAITIYCTGLGAVDGSTPPNAIAAVAAILNSIQMSPSYAGPTAGSPGVYQVTLSIPVATPPGIDLPLLLQQPGGNVVSSSSTNSNTVYVAVQ